MIINKVIKHFVRHFKMDKITSYVFDKNELDDKVKCLEDKIKLLEKIAHPRRDFVVCEECKCKIKEKENG